jgi:hypothetical protein
MVIIGGDSGIYILSTCCIVVTHTNIAIDVKRKFDLVLPIHTIPLLIEVRIGCESRSPGIYCGLIRRIEDIKIR